MKLFENANNDVTYDNILLSKYHFVSKPKLFVKDLQLSLELKYSFKNLDETLLIF